MLVEVSTMSFGTIKQKRSSYDAAFKLQVVGFATVNNNCAAARKFGVDEKQVREWKKRKNNLEEMPRAKKACRTGVAQFSELEKDLSEFVTECRQGGYIVTRNVIRLRALKMSKDESIKQKNQTTF